MAQDEKHVLVNRAIFRANSGLHFLDECLLQIHTGGTDPAYSRSCYILLSYNCELVLKALLLLNKTETTRRELLKGINTHDLQRLANEIPEAALSDIGIKGILKRKHRGFIEYVVEMADRREIVIQDLVDVRYDFEKANLRDSKSDEASRMREEVSILQRIVKKIMAMNQGQGVGSKAKTLS